MSKERATLIVSDLHVGGGAADPGDDHVHDTGQFARFVREQTASAEGAKGRLELFINGDFLEFAQTNQAAFSHLSDALWCTEDESLAKLDTIIAGHPEIFAALREFAAKGNRLTIAAGNHDVDLWWPKVQSRLMATIGEVGFEVGKVWVERHGGMLQIAHGHMADPANRFEHWDDPVRIGDWGVKRLEMCPGTLFMVKFVNKLEGQYPFADNLLPVSRLASVLMRDEKSGLMSVGWMFSRFAMTTSLSVLGGADAPEYGARLLQRFAPGTPARTQLTALAAQHGLATAAGALTPDALSHLMFALMGRIEWSEWQALFELPPGRATLGEADEVTLQALAKAGLEQGKETLRQVARARIDATGAQVVVMGHTHQPDSRRFDGAAYYNPGSWTRYLELQTGQRVTLDDLRDESRYPYALNYVCVEPRPDGRLVHEMRCFERSRGA